MNQIIDCPAHYSAWHSWWAAAIIIFVSLVAIGMFVFPLWGVWASRLSGLASLQEAKNEQQIQIAEAQSRLDAAELNKKAAIIEATAVAEQIKTIGVQLTSHDLYLRWQWIKMMESQDGNTIYVPTEANLPILEAGKRGEVAPSKEDS